MQTVLKVVLHVSVIHICTHISWAFERLDDQSLALSIIKIGSESRNYINSLRVLAILIKSSSAVDVSWRAQRLSFWTGSRSYRFYTANINIIGHRRTTAIYCMAKLHLDGTYRIITFDKRLVDYTSEIQLARYHWHINGSKTTCLWRYL